MAEWRTILWSLGTGASRVSCGVTRTGQEFVIDVLRGDTRFETEVHATRVGAVRRALALETEHRRTMEGAARGREPGARGSLPRE